MDVIASPGPEAAELEGRLTPADQEWLASFGVDPSWQTDPAAQADLELIVDVGSLRLDDPENQGRREEIVSARRQFLEFVGLDASARSAIERRPSLPRVSTFILSQRVMLERGLNAPKIIKDFPAAIYVAPDTMRDKIGNLETLDLDVSKVVNSLPSILGYSKKTVEEKTRSLEKLGLNPESIINSFPTIMGLDMEKVAAKVKYIEEAATHLQWSHDARELIEEFPSILGANLKKLAVMKCIAATCINEDERNASPKCIKSALITTLEQYVIALNDHREDQEGEENGELLSIRKLRTYARPYQKMKRNERRERALEIARSGSLGRIGLLYLDYRNQLQDESQAAAATA